MFLSFLGKTNLVECFYTVNMCILQSYWTQIQGIGLQIGSFSAHLFCDGKVNSIFVFLCLVLEFNYRLLDYLGVILVKLYNNNFKLYIHNKIVIFQYINIK